MNEEEDICVYVKTKASGNPQLMWNFCEIHLLLTSIEVRCTQQYFPGSQMRISQGLVPITYGRSKRAL